MKGRKRQPLEDRRRRGTLERHPEADRAPTIVVGRFGPGDPLPEAPADLSVEGAKVWDLTVHDLAQGGVLDKSDLQSVWAFSTALGAAHEMATELKKQRKQQGRDYFYLKTVRGYVVNPLIGAQRAAIGEARLWAEQLGLSPGARSRLGLRGGDRSPLEELERQIGKPERLRLLSKDA